MTRELLDPSYAMFIPDEETRSLWFNPHSLEVVNNGGVSHKDLVSSQLERNVHIDHHHPALLARSSCRSSSS